MSSWLVALTLLVSAAPVWGQGEPEVYFSSPQSGAALEGAPWVTVTGRARGPRIESTSRFDVMLVLDTSGSTAAPVARRAGQRGLGRHRRGVIRLPRGMVRDSVLGAEVTAALNFLGQLDGVRTRVGVVTFAESATGGCQRVGRAAPHVRSPGRPVGPLAGPHPGLGRGHGHGGRPSAGREGAPVPRGRREPSPSRRAEGQLSSSPTDSRPCPSAGAAGWSRETSTSR